MEPHPRVRPSPAEEPAVTVQWSLVAFVLLAVGAIVALSHALARLDRAARAEDLIVLGLAVLAGAAAWLVWNRREAMGATAGLVAGLAMLLLALPATGAALVLAGSVMLVAVSRERPEARARDDATGRGEPAS